MPVISPVVCEPPGCEILTVLVKFPFANGTVGLKKAIDELGCPKFVWLRRLNISVRNCRRILSLIGNSLESEKSKRFWCGPKREPKRSSPSFPGVGETKQL